MSTIMVRGTFTKSFVSQPVSVFWYVAFKITVLHVLYNISVNLKVRYNINIARHIVPESHFQSCDRKGENVVVKNSFLCSIKVTIFRNNTALIRNIIAFFRNTFISILIMTQLHPRDPENRQQNRCSEWRFSEKKPPVTTGWMGKRGLSANNAQFVSVD